MDTKLKDNKKFYYINIVVILALLAMSFGIQKLYPNLKEWTKGQDFIPYEEYEMQKIIFRSNYVLYKDLINQQNSEEQTSDKIYIKSYDRIHDADIMIGHFNLELDSWKEDLNYTLKNLNYLAYSDNIKVNKTNTNNNLELLLDNTDDILKNEYAYYMVIKYDENGVASLSNIYGADENIIKNLFSKFTLRDYWNYHESENTNIRFNPIKNTTFIYGIPKDLKYIDRISEIINDATSNINYHFLICIIGLILFCILILGLLIPYKIGKLILGVDTFFKIPFEINCIIFGFGAFGVSLLTSTTVLKTLKNTLMTDFIGVSTVPNIEYNNIIVVVNIIVWMITIYSIFAGDMLLKHIFNFGLTKYFKEKLLIIKIIKSLKKSGGNIINYIEHIDLTDKSNKFLIKALLINYLILIFISSVWFFGIIISFLYSIVLFYLLRKYYVKLKDKFHILLSATNEISNGNLEIKIDKDLGMFNPIKENIEKIQNGLKNAVNEEVKSQRMKTELISNVSHDLKTPLTSIITYVDLLKKDNTTEEERISYIDTIDKKAQRLKFLIEDLFEVSRATSGDIKLNMVKVDIVELMKQTIVELEDKIKNSNLKMKINYAHDKIILELDSQKTFRILENLLVNVVKYALEGSRVYIDIVDKSNKVEITIKNISAEEINFDPFDIVERFQRGDKSRNTEGAGLGLAIAKSFVEVQGGTLNIEVDGDLFKVVIIFSKPDMHNDH